MRLLATDELQYHCKECSKELSKKSYSKNAPIAKALGCRNNTTDYEEKGMNNFHTLGGNQEM